MSHKPLPIVGLEPSLSLSSLVQKVWGVLLMVAFAFVLSSPTLDTAHAQDVLGGPKYKPYPSFKERKKIRAERALKRYIREENERRKREGLPSLEEEEAERLATIKRNEEKIAAMKLAKQRIEERKKAAATEQESFEMKQYKGNFSNDNIYRLGKIYILSPWSPETLEGEQTALLYLTIVNPTDKDEQLIDITSPEISLQIEARVSKTTGTMKGLEPVETLTIPARSSVQFNAGGMHFSMLSLQKPLKAGKSFHLLFRFKNNGNGLINAVVTKRKDYNPFPIDNNVVANIFEGIYSKKAAGTESAPAQPKQNVATAENAEQAPEGEQAEEKPEDKASDTTEQPKEDDKKES